MDRVHDIEDRSHFLGGSDARVIMGNDEAALLRLWREKRGQSQPPDLSENLIVALGLVTEGLNRCWYERMSGHRVGGHLEELHGIDVSPDLISTITDAVLDEVADGRAGRWITVIRWCSRRHASQSP